MLKTTSPALSSGASLAPRPDSAPADQGVGVQSAELRGISVAVTAHPGTPAQGARLPPSPTSPTVAALLDVLRESLTAQARVLPAGRVTEAWVESAARNAACAILGAFAVEVRS